MQPTIASGDQIGHTAALEERGQLAARIENINKLDHFHQTQTDNGRLRVVAQLKAIDETSAASHNVLLKTKLV